MKKPLRINSEDVVSSEKVLKFKLGDKTIEVPTKTIYDFSKVEPELHEILITAIVKIT